MIVWSHRNWIVFFEGALPHLLKIVTGLQATKVAFSLLNGRMDTTTQQGGLLSLGVFAALTQSTIKGIPAMIRHLTHIGFLVLAVMFPTVQADGTVDKVLREGRLHCGVGENLHGFAVKDVQGQWQGFNVDFCRAVAAAILGDGRAVDFMPLTPVGALPALLSGQIDLISAATLTFGREAAIGLVFPGIYFLDGQSLIVQKSIGAKRIEDLGKATVCVRKGTTSETAVANAFQRRGLAYQPLVIETLPDTVRAFKDGRCQAVAGVRSALAAWINHNPDESSRFEILPGYISMEPMGPVVRQGDDRWMALVRWVLYALIEAEEREISRSQVLAQRESASDPIVHRFLVDSGPLGKPLGLRPDWVVKVIATVGNYGEMFDRNLGEDSPLKIERAYNRLWKHGGLLYSPPFQ